MTDRPSRHKKLKNGLVAPMLGTKNRDHGRWITAFVPHPEPGGKLRQPAVFDKPHKTLEGEASELEIVSKALKRPEKAPRPKRGPELTKPVQEASAEPVGSAKPEAAPVPTRPEGKEPPNLLQKPPEPEEAAPPDQLHPRQIEEQKPQEPAKTPSWEEEKTPPQPPRPQKVITPKIIRHPKDIQLEEREVEGKDIPEQLKNWEEGAELVASMQRLTSKELSLGYAKTAKLYEDAKAKYFWLKDRDFKKEGKLSDEAVEVNQEMRKLKAAREKFKKQYQSERKEALGHLTRALAGGEKHEFKASLQDLPEPRRKVFEGGRAWFQRVYRKLTGDPDLPEVPVRNSPERSEFLYEDGVIRFYQKADAAVAVHELVHFLELHDERAREAVKQFAKHRFGDEGLSSLNDRFPGMGYGKNEWGRKDHFDRYFGIATAYYVGRSYGVDSKFSEILTMGAEALFRDPIGFCAADPEYAQFVIGVLSGNIRGKKKELINKRELGMERVAAAEPKVPELRALKQQPAEIPPEQVREVPKTEEPKEIPPEQVQTIPKETAPAEPQTPEASKEEPPKEEPKRSPVPPGQPTAHEVKWRQLESLAGVQPQVHEEAKNTAQTEVDQVKPKREELRNYHTEAREKGKRLIEHLRKLGRSPSQNNLTPEEQKAYAEAILKVRLSEAALKGKVIPPKNQKELLSKVHRDSKERDLNDAMRELSGVQLEFRGQQIPKKVGDQFDAHGTPTLETLTRLLNNGIDPDKEFYTSPITAAYAKGKIGIEVRDNSPFVVLGHPGETLKEGGIAAVLVDPLHTPSIPLLKEAFPGIKFVPAEKAAQVLAAVAAGGGKPVSYGEPKRAPVSKQPIQQLAGPSQEEQFQKAEEWTVPPDPKAVREEVERLLEMYGDVDEAIYDIDVALDFAKQYAPEQVPILKEAQRVLDEEERAKQEELQDDRQVPVMVGNLLKEEFDVEGALRRTRREAEFFETAGLHVSANLYRKVEKHLLEKQQEEDARVEELRKKLEEYGLGRELAEEARKRGLFQIVTDEQKAYEEWDRLATEAEANLIEEGTPEYAAVQKAKDRHFDLLAKLGDTGTIFQKMIFERLKGKAAKWKAKMKGRVAYKNPSVLKGQDFVSNLVSSPTGGRDVPTEMISQGPMAEKPKRAWADDQGIHLNDYDSAQVWIHEFGHWLEARVPGVHQSARAFLRHRFKGEELVDLNDVISGGGYGETDKDGNYIPERGRKDRFEPVFGEHAWYVGVHYSDGQTELVSMLLQKLFQNPLQLASQDPEAFSWILGVCDGSLHLKGEEVLGLEEPKQFPIAPEFATLQPPQPVGKVGEPTIPGWMNPSEVPDVSRTWFSAEPTEENPPEFLERTPLRKSLATQPVHKVRPLAHRGGTVSMRVILADGTQGVFKPAYGETYKDHHGKVVLPRPYVGPNLYVREATAADFAEVLGLGDIVPTTVIRSAGGQVGSVQAFIANAMEATEADEDLIYGEDEELALIAAFDYLIGNSDRHEGNWMVRGSGRIKLPGRGARRYIDNGLAFPFLHALQGGFTKQLRKAAERGLGAHPVVRRDWYSLWENRLRLIMERRRFNKEEIALTGQRAEDLAESKSYVTLHRRAVWARERDELDLPREYLKRESGTVVTR